MNALMVRTNVTSMPSVTTPMEAILANVMKATSVTGKTAQVRIELNHLTICSCSCHTLTFLAISVTSSYLGRNHFLELFVAIFKVSSQPSSR